MDRDDHHDRDDHRHVRFARGLFLDDFSPYYYQNDCWRYEHVRIHGHLARERVWVCS